MSVPDRAAAVRVHLGFSIEEDGSAPNLTGPEALPVSSWAEHVRLLETAHPAWRFRKEPSDAL
jgi:hypothetical protein